MWLPVLALFAVPFGRSVELFVLIMMVLGLKDLINNHKQIRQSNVFLLFSLVFVLLWAPATLSIFDAVSLDKTIKTTVGMLRFYLAGVFIISRINTTEMHQKIGLSFAAIISFWAVDGWLQATTGQGFLGIETSSSTRISGIFGENARLGLMIVPFFSMALFSLKKLYGTMFAVAIGLLLISAILMSGDRASWLSLLVTLFLYAVLFGRSLLSLSFKQVSILLIALSIVVVSVLSIPRFQQRIDSITTGFDGSYSSVNKASSSRLPLWETAYKMFLDNPINGVGARSFRYAYPDYASSDDPFVDFSLAKDKQQGQTHAHQVVLEFAADTGLIGLVGYTIVLWFIYVKWLPLAVRSNAGLSLGYLISLAVIFFPINTHQSFFSSHWGQVVWLIMALALASLATECDRKKLLFGRQELSE